jgi:hypothetical protein
MDTCGRCGKSLEQSGGISVTGVGDRCHACFNAEAAARLGVDFDRTPIEPVVVADADADGVQHTFQTRSRMVGTGHAMEAIEMPRLSEVEGFTLYARIEDLSGIARHHPLLRPGNGEIARRVGRRGRRAPPPRSPASAFRSSWTSVTVWQPWIPRWANP